MNRGGKMQLTHLLNEQAWQDFIDHRKDIKKKLTERAQKKQIEFLCRYDFKTQQDIVDTSIRNGWQGLFEPRGQANAAHKQPNNSTNAIYYGLRHTDF
jgi:hypothetical protein